MSSMDGEVSSMDGEMPSMDVIHGWRNVIHGWKCHPWMPSMDDIHGWRRRMTDMDAAFNSAVVLSWEIINQYAEGLCVDNLKTIVGKFYKGSWLKWKRKENERFAALFERSGERKNRSIEIMIHASNDEKVRINNEFYSFWSDWKKKPFEKNLIFGIWPRICLSNV